MEIHFYGDSLSIQKSWDVEALITYLEHYRRDAFNQGNYHAFHNILLLDDYLLIKYEDLLESTTKFMRKVADYLDIPFSKQLL